MRTLAAVAAATGVLLAGCGAGEEPAGDATALADGSALEAVDELLSPRALAALVSPANSSELECEPELTPEDCRQMTAAMQAGELEWLPAPGETPRAVARLRLSGGGSVLLVEYVTGAGRPCAAVIDEGAPEDGALETGGFACDDAYKPSCAKACLDGIPAAADGRPALLFGTVDAAADGLRLTFGDGSDEVHPLTGPLSRLEPSRRIFLVEAGGGRFSVQELLVGDEVIERMEDGGLPSREAGPMGTHDVSFDLDGTTLRVEIGEDATPDAQAVLFDNNVVFACVGADSDADDVELPPAHAFGRFPPGERTVAVELRAPVSGRPIACFVAGGLEGDEPGAFRLLVSPEELEGSRP